jgi:peptide/nickel transport system ATP-binding protein
MAACEPDVLLDVRDLRTNFYIYKGVVKALDGVTFKVYRGETLALVGETGCGKSVTTTSILRLIPMPPGKIEGGEALFRGVDLLKLPLEELRRVRGKDIAMIFQDPMTYINPVFTIGNQLAEVIALHQDLTSEILEEKIEKLEKARKALRDEIEELSKALKVLGDKPDRRAKLEARLKELRAREPERRAKLEARLKELKAQLELSRQVSYKELETLKIRMRRKGLCAEDKADIKAKIAELQVKLKQLRKPSGRQVKRAAMKKAKAMLDLVRMPYAEQILHQYPHELSGGMRQRAMIAQALSCKPDLLIADEATTSLDVTIQAQVLALLNDLKAEIKGSAIIIITHDLGVVAEMCDRVIVMYAGTIVEEALTERLFHNPLHPYTKGLMSAIPKIHVKQERLEIIPGAVPNLVDPPGGCRFHPRCALRMEICDSVKPEPIEVEPGHFVACHLFTPKKPSKKKGT